MVNLNKGATVELVKALSDDIRTLTGSGAVVSFKFDDGKLYYTTDGTNFVETASNNFWVETVH